jgi:ABC-type ATPase involved in cell division
MSMTLDRVTRKVGGETHIHEVGLELAPGSRNVLLGPTLSGKTSLMRLVAGLDRPNTGRIIVDGVDVTGWSVRTRSVAMVYQQCINYPPFTVYENIASPLRRVDAGRAEIDRRVRETAAMLHIEELLPRRSAELSGGQRAWHGAAQRAWVGRRSRLRVDGRPGFVGLRAGRPVSVRLRTGTDRPGFVRLRTGTRLGRAVTNPHTPTTDREIPIGGARQESASNSGSGPHFPA